MEIECEYKDLIGESGKQYFCYVTSATITKPDTKIESFIGVHKSGKSDNDVKGNKFDNTVVEYFPKNLHKIFPQLNSVVISNCGLKRITRNDLNGLENISEFYLDGNQLRSLPVDLFVNMKKLKEISFRNNKLEFVSSSMLIPILNNKVTRFDLADNPTVDIFLEKNFGHYDTTLDQIMREIDRKCKKPIEIEDYDFEKFKDNFMKSSKDLWESGKYSDFVIITEGPNYPVHKLVLGGQSSVFADIFEKHKDQKELHIKGLSAMAIEEFLCFLYTGEVPSAADMMEIFTLSAKFNIELLKRFSEKAIIETLDETNAYKALSLAHRHSSDIMQRFSFDEIKKMFPGTILPDTLMNDCEKLKELIDAKRNVDALLKKI
jgi:hypothetical protein